ncbi:3-hydroxybutyryl-CoA dehydrogenase [Chitinophaga costaii]|uniref:3-hydroxybutyryl-CoA dehydrogenase n=1 Tax=Chitinophaga costaii TaxID=1335309 RepID=A0A1C4FRK9_9BACT|nr:3-hydroxyacyl-CoA dehydrogenase family protein [Chitinophaga costaii]SCC58506.1 3-hydroxybutyryl-CoA dehydrogenase [Chitinophaga costaii]
MNILVTGDAARWQALQQRNFSGCNTLYQAAIDHIDLTAYTMVIDLSLDDTPGNASHYAQYPETMVLGNVVKTSLQAITKHYNAGNIIGCNWLPGFGHMLVLEVSCSHAALWEKWRAMAGMLQWAYERVEDLPGMVTPRVVSMIINEAYFTVEEGTASREDIDMAMKLGTNYPFGPFEWSTKIGLDQVYGILQAVQAATGLARYAICPLLAAEAFTIKS